MRRGFYFLLLMCDGPFKNRWFTNGFPKEKGNSIIQCPSPKSGMLTMVHMYVHIKYVYTKFWGHIANTQMIPWLVEICYLWVDLPCRSTPPINCTQWNLFFLGAKLDATQRLRPLPPQISWKCLILVPHSCFGGGNGQKSKTDCFILQGWQLYLSKHS